MTKRSEDVWFAVGDEVRTYRGTLLTVNEWLTDEEAEEVARIAAAAPQMLQALEKFVDWALWMSDIWEVGFPPQDNSIVSLAQNAIKKAKGEEDEF